MSPDDIRDVRRTLAFTTQKLAVSNLPLALGLLLLGLVAARFTDRGGVVAGWILIVISLAGIVYIAWRRTYAGKPILVLSPEGIDIRIVAVKVVRIPWREIMAIEAGDVVGTIWLSRGPTSVTFANVTQLLVSIEFYYKFIHVDSFFMRGPGWNANYQLEGNRARVMVHHETVCLDPEDLRAAIEARWQAFRGEGDGKGEAYDTLAASNDQSAPHVPSRTHSQTLAQPLVRPPARMPSVITRRRGWFSSAPQRADTGSGSAPQPLPWISSGWDALKIALALAGIAVLLGNFAGVWETADQKATRIDRQKWAEELKRDQEEQRKRDKYWEDFWKDVDRSMNRP